jgi:hypothetical protein
VSKVLTIFRKDVRHLWPLVLVFFATAALAVVADPALDVRGDYYFLLRLALEPLACWVLIVTAIHEERLIGHEQYWLTRPYTWKHLVAAKALFLAVFVSLPLFICQCATLLAIGSTPNGWIAGLVWHQVFFAIFVILPAVALAAVTANLAQALGCAVVSLMVFLFAFGGSTQDYDWGGLAWIRTSAVALVLLGGIAAVVIVQYTRRRTGMARIVLAATAVFAAAVASTHRWDPAFAVQRLFARQSVSAAAVSLSVNASASGSHPAEMGGDSPGPRLDIPLRVRGLPPGLWLGGEGVSVTLEAPGAVWRSGRLPADTLQGLRDEVGWIRVPVAPDFYDRWKDTPVKLSASADLVLYQHVRDTPYPDRGLIEFPDTGICGNLERMGWLSCSTPFLQLTVTLEQADPRDATTLHQSFAPFPTVVGFRPFDEVERLSLLSEPQPAWHLSFDRPVTYIQRRIEAREIRMKDLVRE